jgi:hypothetical protein
MRHKGAGHRTTAATVEQAQGQELEVYRAQFTATLQRAPDR